jgi:hypothetical protein
MQGIHRYRLVGFDRAPHRPAVWADLSMTRTLSSLIARLHERGCRSLSGSVRTRVGDWHYPARTARAATGELPVARLKARLNAASDPYPTR